MKLSTRLVALVVLTVVVATVVMAQPVRKDAVWARMVPAGTITLDGVLNEAAWSKAESIRVQWGVNFADPGSGYRGESGVNGGSTPTDSTDAMIKFLASTDNKLYIAVHCKDKSIGGGLFNHFDGFLMNMRDRSKADRPVPAFEYFYGWVTEGWADPATGAVGASPGFFGWAGGKRTDSTGGIPNSQIWNAATKVWGTSNADTNAAGANVADTAWVTELEFTLSHRGYDVAKTGGDIVMFNISIYDNDYEWPMDTTKQSGNRTWLQGPWGNASAYSHLRIWADPTVTTSTTTLPALPYDLSIYHASTDVVPVIDGQLNDAVWDRVPGFRIKYGDAAVRNGYRNTMPYRSGQFQPEVNGQRADVLDPADALVRMFFKGDTLFVGVDVSDKVVQDRDEFDRQDGLRLLLKDRSERDAAENILVTREIFIRVDSAGTMYLGGYAPVLASDTIAAEKRGSRFALGLKTGTTVDTIGSQEDNGYQIEMKINLRALGYAAGRGDGALWVGALLLDGDTFGSSGVPPYGNRVWFAQEGAWNDGPAFAYMDPTLVTAVEGEVGAVPASFEVFAAYPNPFNPSTTIGFALPQMANVKILVFDVLGRLVSSRTLYGLSAGRQGYQFDASGLTSGAYVYQVQMLDMTTGNIVAAQTGKMMLVK
jgi:hypothetical protein